MAHANKHKTYANKQYKTHANKQSKAYADKQHSDVKQPQSSNNSLMVTCDVNNKQLVKWPKLIEQLKAFLVTEDIQQPSSFRQTTEAFRDQILLLATVNQY